MIWNDPCYDSCSKRPVLPAAATYSVHSSLLVAAGLHTGALSSASYCILFPAFLLVFIAIRIQPCRSVVNGAQDFVQ